MLPTISRRPIKLSGFLFISVVGSLLFLTMAMLPCFVGFAEADKAAVRMDSRAMWRLVDPAGKCIHHPGRISTAHTPRVKYGTVVIADNQCGNGQVVLSRPRRHSGRWRVLGMGSDWGYPARCKQDLKKIPRKVLEDFFGEGTCAGSDKRHRTGGRDRRYHFEGSARALVRASHRLQLNRAMAGVRLGDSIDRLHRLLGEPKNIDHVENEITGSLRIDVYGMLSFTSYSGSILGMRTTRRSIRTPTGIGVGTRKRRLERKLPGLVCYWHRCAIVAGGGLQTIGKRVTTFQIRAGRVRVVSIGRVID
jgi:hypothetical protein